MTSLNVFRLTQLAVMVGLVGMSANSYAVYNLYKKDGLSLDINGQVDIQATRQDYVHEILNDADQSDYYRNNGVATVRTVDQTYTKTSTDRKPRLGQTQGVSYVEFRGSQELPNDWRITGNLGLGYSDSRDMYLNNTSLSFDKKGIGAISIGRQYLHTNYVNRTGTDTPLDIFSSSALRLDYYGVKGLHTSAYYSFTGVNDVRVDDNTGAESGFGASISYRHPFADRHYVRVATGYTQTNANPAYVPSLYNGNDFGRMIDNTLNRYPAKTQGVAASVEYQAGKFLVAADLGRKKETMSSSTNTPLDHKTSDYVGAKVAYDINPVFQVSAGYGLKKTKSELKAGAAALSATSFSSSYVDGDDIYLFDEAKTKEVYLQADYRIRPNVRLYTRFDGEKTTYKVENMDYARIKDNNLRAGVVFNF
ncbi:MAG: hypothetical protein Q4D05_00305 [Acinetobacter sp.]|nr:hypothetical protein [Acinetobacter sp.]